MPDGHRINFLHWYSTISSSPHLKLNSLFSFLSATTFPQSLRNSIPDFSISISSTTISCHPTQTPGMYQCLSPCSIKLFLPSLSTTASLNIHYYMRGQLLSGLQNYLTCSASPRALSKILSFVLFTILQNFLKVIPTQINGLFHLDCLVFLSSSSGDRASLCSPGLELAMVVQAGL